MKPVVTLMVLAAAAFAAQGASFSTNPSADAFVTTGPSGDLLGINYGGAGALSLAAPGLPKGEFQCVVRFDLAPARASFDGTFGAGQWSLQSVTLQLNATLGNNPIFNTPAAGLFGVSWMENDAWMEGTGGPSAPGTSGITFASLHSTFIGAGDENLGTLSFNGIPSGVTAYALGLTPGLEADVLAGGQLSLRLFAADSGVSGLFNSRSTSTLANRPLLTLVAVPEPGALGLAGLGLVLLGGWRCLSRGRS